MALIIKLTLPFADLINHYKHASYMKDVYMKSVGLMFSTESCKPCLKLKAEHKYDILSTYFTITSCFIMVKQY